MDTIVNTVLGPVPANSLGIVAMDETLLHVLPGAQYAYDITLDRAEIFDALAASLRDFRNAGGGAVVDAGGMFAGRDLPLYEALSRATGIHIIASSGQMEEAMLGGYFLTPQTDPPTPWPAEKFAALYGAEVVEGMVVPRVERRAAAGLIATAITVAGRTPTDESQLRGAAQAAARTGVPLRFRAGPDPLGELAVALDEGLAASRAVVVGAGAHAAEVAVRGASVVCTEPAALDAMVTAGHADRALYSTGAAALAFGEQKPAASYANLITAVPEGLRQQVLVDNPARLLAVAQNRS